MNSAAVVPGSASNRVVSARSRALIPVVIPARASHVTVYAVDLASSLCSVMGGSARRSARSAVMGTHTTPELCRIVKPMSGWVACWAAKTRSPSFSRSSSSTTTTAAPEAIAATASATGSRATPRGVAGAAYEARRSAYLASTSTSRFTVDPGVRAPSVVARRVSGIRPTSNHASGSSAGFTAVTVRDTPSTAIDPLTAMYRARAIGTLIRTVSHPVWAVRCTTVPTPSTWPWTTCPSRRCPAAVQRSTLTRSPCASAPRVVRRSVSPMTSAVKSPSAPEGTAVRHTPLTASEPPWGRSATSGPADTCSRAASCANRSTRSTVAWASTIPVNTDSPWGSGVRAGFSGTARREVVM